MDEFDDILGIYKATEKESNSEFSNDFILKLYKENNSIKFDFIMTTQGNFGKIGKNWYGKGIFRSDHLALIIEQEKDWTYTANDNKTTEYLRDKYESLPVEIYTEEEKAIIYHKNLNRYIILKRQYYDD